MRDWLLAFFAAFGVLCVFWAAFGWLLPQCREGCILYPGKAGELSFVPVYLWLRGMGILRCPLVLLDLDLTEGQKQELEQKGIELCAVEDLPSRLEMGAKET